MAYSGYPTPDIDPNQQFVNVCITIPSSLGDVFYQVLLGQISEMSKDYYWKKAGTMSPEDCAFLWAQTLALTPADLEGCTTMTCEEVSDCIENNIDTQQAMANAIVNSTVIQDAINQTIVNNGSGTGNVSQPLPSSIMATNVIPQSALCTESNKYAMALALVRALDVLTNDMLDVIELLTNPNEIAAEMVEGVPIFGNQASLVLDTAAWLQDNITDAYAAAYNATTEGDYACEVYCIFQNCEMSWDDLIQAYYNGGSLSPPASNSFIDVLDWLITTVIPASDNAIVGAMHTFILWSMKWGSDWFGSGVWTYMEIELENAADEEITVPQSCACAPVYPVIVQATSGGSCEIGKPFGIVESLGNGDWRVTAEDDGAGSWWAQWAEENGADIVVSNLVFEGDTAFFVRYCTWSGDLGGGVVTSSFPSPNIEYFRSSRNNPANPQTIYTFHAEFP